MASWVRRLCGLLVLGACTRQPQAGDFVRFHADGDAKLPCVFWPRRTLGWQWTGRGPTDAELRASEAAFLGWAEAAAGCSDLHFAARAPGATVDVTLHWRDVDCSTAAPSSDPCHSQGNCAEQYNCWEDARDVLAVTSLTYSRSMGTLLGSTLQLNSAQWLFTTVDAPRCSASSASRDCVSTDVQNTLTHEIGHVLGFEHFSNPNSTMAAQSPPGDLAKRKIDVGTQSGLCAVYPREQPSPSCP